MATIQRAGLQRGDLALWDGVTSSVSRPDATGGTVTGLVVGDRVDVLQVYGSGSSRTQATISTATARIGAAKASLQFAVGTWTIDSNTTIPRNFACHIPAGCVFSVASGVTLTIAGSIEGDRTQIFSGAGDVVLSTPDKIYPEWWGAIADGTTDSSTAIQAALDSVEAALGSVVQFSPGTYRWDGAITLPRYVSMRGCGWSTVLKPLSSSGVFNIVNGNNVIEDIFFEGSVTTPGSYVGTCFVVGTTDFTGHNTFRRIYIRRFQLGVRSRASLWARYEQCRIEFNRTGIDFDSLSASHQNNATSIIDCLIGFNERQGIATSSATIANRGLLIQGGSIEGNGDEDYTTYEQCQLNRFSDFKITTYFESISADEPDALTVDNCGSGEITACSFIGARDAIKDTTGSTTARILIARNTGSGITGRAIDLAGGTDNEAYRNSWGSPGSANILTGTRSRDYTNRKAEFLNEQTAFTPTLFGAGTAGSPTYTIQSGFYSRIDNIIFYQGRITISAKGGMAGAIRIGNLPAASANVTHAQAPGSVLIDGCTVSGGQTSFIGNITANAQYVELIQQGAAASDTIDAADLADATTVIFSGWYVAA